MRNNSIIELVLLLTLDWPLYRAIAPSKIKVPRPELTEGQITIQGASIKNYSTKPMMGKTYRLNIKKYILNPKKY